jgi:hypothetical protein
MVAAVFGSKSQAWQTIEQMPGDVKIAVPWGWQYRDGRGPVGLIIVRLMGGLGNQMFQYAAGRALALRQRASLKLDLSGFSANPKRHYELDAFPIAASMASESELAAFGFHRAEHRWVQRARRLLRMPKQRRTWPIYHEKHFHFDAAATELHPPVCLEGWWQTEKYFVDQGEILRREFTPMAPLEPENAALAKQIAEVDAVSLHVRRGDYVAESNTNRVHGTCSVDYYREAVEYITARVQSAHLFVFSDDHDWTRNNLGLAIPATFVSANSVDRGFRDMQLMSRCRHHIVANSSFSWWGAWLNPSPSKIVVAPRRWFGVSDYDTRDLIPETWVRL